MDGWWMEVVVVGFIKFKDRSNLINDLWRKVPKSGTILENQATNFKLTMKADKS